MQKYKTKGNRGIFDEEMTCDQLSEIGNPITCFDMYRQFD